MQAQKDRAWAMLLLAQASVDFDDLNLTKFMTLMHQNNNPNQHKLLSIIRAQFPKGEKDSTMWAQERGNNPTQFKIAHALVDLLREMCRMGKNGFEATVFMPTKAFDPRFVTCLFVCGLIDHPYMSFEKLDLDAAGVAIRDTSVAFEVDLEEAADLIRDDDEVADASKLSKFGPGAMSTVVPADRYTYKLLAYLLAPVAYIDLHVSTGAAAVLKKEDKVPANLFVATGAPTDGSVCILDALETRSWSDYLLRGHTITSKVELWYVFFMWLCRPSKVGVGSYGVKIGTYSCIFIYNLPPSPVRPALDREIALKNYIEQPCNAYTASMQALGIISGDVISKLDRYDGNTFNSKGLLYIHLLVMASVATKSPTRRFFTWIRNATASTETAVHDALCLAGDTYGNITAKLQYTPTEHDFPFSYVNKTRRTEAIDQLAVAHLDLMTGGGPENMHTETVVFTSTCPVKYAWVFEYQDLLRGDTFKPEFRRQVGESELDSPNMAVFECIYELIKEHLIEDEKTYYMGRFDGAHRTSSANSAAPVSGSAGNTQLEAFSDRDSGTDTSTGEPEIDEISDKFNQEIVAQKAKNETQLANLLGLVTRLKSDEILRSAAMHGHSEHLRSHTTLLGFSQVETDKLLAQLHEEMARSAASIAVLSGEMKQLYDDMKREHEIAEKLKATLQLQHELEVDELKTKLENMTVQLDACTLRAEQLELDKTDLERRLLELEARFSALQVENAALVKEVEDHKASHSTLKGAADTEKQGLIDEIASQKAEIERLSLRITELEKELASLQTKNGEILAARLKLTEDYETLLKEFESMKAAHLKYIRDSANTTRAHQTEMQKLRKENAALREAYATGEKDNERTLNLVRSVLERSLNDNKEKINADLKMVNADSAASTRKLNRIANLTEAGHLAAFYASVASEETTKVAYTLPALFLICESIAGTWKLKKEGVTETVTEKVAYDCRAYASIEEKTLADSRIKEYASPLFYEFVSTVKGVQS